MEGAAFMYACLIHQVPFAQVRAVSNTHPNKPMHPTADTQDVIGSSGAGGG